MSTSTIGRIDDGYDEAEKQEEPTARLEDWSSSISQISGTGMLYGTIYEDVRKRFVDGALIHTSLITDISQTFEEGSIIKTTYSTYLLGKKKYER